MPIFLDASELRTTLPPIPGAVALPGLEEQTGADLMVSPINIPATTLPLIECHVAAGALLVQGKWSAGDLAASLRDDRMLAALSKMRDLVGSTRGPFGGIGAPQCVLLYCGPVPTVGTAEYSALSKWADRGGRVEPPLYDVSEVPYWCKLKEKHLVEYQAEPIRWVYDNLKRFETSPEDDPLQLLARIPPDDPRRLLVTLDGVGPKLAQAWWEWSNLHPSECDGSFLGLAAQMACVGKDCEKVPGWGPGKAQRVRAHLGLPDGLDFRGYWRLERMRRK